jgi:hypothetical protein
MTIPRRTFLRDALTSTLSVGLLLTATRATFSQKGTESGVPIEAQKEPVFLFTELTFEPYVGDIFTTPNARGEAIELKLVKLQKHEPKNELTKLARATKSFSLVFKASDELPPFTSIYTISHPRLGKFDLFLTRRKTHEGVLFYEAVFNHVE